MEKKNKLLLENKDFRSGWLCGMVDGEGCFCVSFNLKKSMPCGIEVRPSFSISQKSHSLNSVEFIKEQFQCGGIRYSKKDGTYKYETRSIDDIKLKILPFFRKYSLYTKKQEDFILFDEICQLILSGQHLNSKGLKEILIKSYKLNGSGKRKYSLEYLLKFIGELNV
jgi:hypothetical protein